jgi:hypothetical protein
MRNQKALGAFSPKVFHEPYGFIESHQPRPAALLARFDDGSSQTIELGATRLDDRPLGQQGNKPGHAQLGRLLHEPVEPFSLWNGRGEGHFDRREDLGEIFAQFQRDGLLPRVHHDRLTGAPPAIEQLNLRPGR